MVNPCFNDKFSRFLASGRLPACFRNQRQTIDLGLRIVQKMQGDIIESFGYSRTLLRDEEWAVHFM
ncbi:hypothetical protein JCM31598_32390 [Desulfonatronum parangueonense]